jgi:hypothetical protein
MILSIFTFAHVLISLNRDFLRISCCLRLNQRQAARPLDACFSLDHRTH